MSGKTLLVDADVLRYQIAFGNEDTIAWDDDDETSIYTQDGKAEAQVEEFILDLQERFKTDSLVIVLSGTTNYRVELDETYKANRKDKPKPQLWQLVSDYLEWGDHGHDVVQMPRLEGDDVLGILHTGEYLGKSIILTIDKDMLTIPGLIYRWNRPEEGTVNQSPRDAAFFHLTQVLEGDTVDNYKGCPGIGKVKAAKIRDACETPEEMWEVIVEAYEAAMLKAVEKGREPPFTDPEAAAIHQARLAFILRSGWYDIQSNKVKLWTPQQLKGL